VRLGGVGKAGFVEVAAIRAVAVVRLGWRHPAQTLGLGVLRAVHQTHMNSL
jgi:hypothetical protein